MFKNKKAHLFLTIELRLLFIYKYTKAISFQVKSKKKYMYINI